MPLFFQQGQNPIANFLGDQQDQGPYNNSSNLLGLGLGLLSGKTPQEQVGNAASSFANSRQMGRMNNQTVKFLQTANPELAQAVQAGALSPADAYKLHFAAQSKNRSFQTLPNGDYGFADESTGAFQKLGTAAKPVEQFHQLTPEEITTRHLDPSKAYQVGIDNKVDAIGGGGITINNGPDKAPSGFRYVNPSDPNSALAAIPGGPATQLPAETAGRIGLADSFLTQLPDIKKNVHAGNVTGWVDRGIAGNNSSSSQADTYRKIQSGVDALTRMLTGAGQNEQEARNYAERYLPTYTDDATSAEAKVDQLAKELQSAGSTVMRGHEGPSVTPPASGGVIPPHVEDLVKKYGG